MARRELYTSEALEEDIVKSLATLKERANLKADEFYEPLMLIGNARVKVWVALKLQGSWLSVPEIMQMSDLSKTSVYDALTELDEFRLIQREGYMYKLIPDIRNKS